ncbi:MAG: hypothetical protein ACK5L0_00570 [Candidatus Fimivivens sp.]
MLKSTKIDAKFKREGDAFVATGEYEDSTEQYRVEIAKDGNFFKIRDDEDIITATFEDSEVTADIPK